ncbi:MAG: PD40 domain-containing protein [Chloroflexi bacterium]|nr:PD40 domain-containing protein [Chloroflexota bacterium]
MSEPRKLLTTFDKILLAGTVLGIMGICVLIGVFYSIWMNPPSQMPDPTPFATLPLMETPTTPAFDLPTPTFMPTLVSSPVPTFSGDESLGGRIVFTCYIKQVDQICIINADGSNREQVTHAAATAFYASLAPDGSTIYFSSRESGEFQIYSIKTNGEDLKRLTQIPGSFYAPEISPNGEWIVMTKGGDGIWLMKPDGTNPHAITFADDIDPAWSPDGSMISFASSRLGERQLFIMNANGSNVRQVTEIKDMGGRSTWSPDGTKLAFYAGILENHNIYVINSDGTNLTQLTDGGDNLGPSWSLDGKWIAFTSFRDGNNEIYIMHPDGSSVTRLTNNLISDWQPRWGK